MDEKKLRMVPPPQQIGSSPIRRRDTPWREPAPYPYDFEMMSPHPYAPPGSSISSRGPPPPGHPYRYGGSSNDNYPSGPISVPSSSHGGSPPPNDYGMPQSSSRESYWGSPPPPPSSYDGYRTVGPRGSPRRFVVPYPSQHQQYRSPSRRGPFGVEQQVGLEPRTLPPSPGEHHLFQQQQNQQRKEFCPPAPVAPPIGQSPTTRGVQVTVSASADSEETIASHSSTKKEDGNKNDVIIYGNDSRQDNTKKEKGDSLSALAILSAGMRGKNKDEKNNERRDTNAETKGDKTESFSTETKVDDDGNNDRNDDESNSYNNKNIPPMPTPTSPLQRQMKPSPITPSQTPLDATILTGTKRTLPTERQHQPITPSRSHESSSTAGGGSQHSLPPPGWEPPPSLPHGGSGVDSSGDLYSSHQGYTNSSPNYQNGKDAGGPSSRSNRNNRPRIHYRSSGRDGFRDFVPPFSSDSPALVERGSFDSHGDASSYKRGTPLYPPTTPTSSRRGAHFYDEHPPPPPGFVRSGSSSTGGAGYWDSGPHPPPYSPPYPSSNQGSSGGWIQPLPHPASSSSSHSDPYCGSPHSPLQDYPYPPPPPPRYGGPGDHDLSMYGTGAPPPPPAPYYYREGPLHRPGTVPMYPGTYGHPPLMEEKTILRKKFSWKHYPELERFLIANRDEYLKHSALNYTAEQKQYNNWLTERLLEMAGKYNYMFDPDDFNFVAIRDRIRCYYKSYVQTARKRGFLQKKGAKSKKIAHVSTTTTTTTAGQKKK